MEQESRRQLKQGYPAFFNKTFANKTVSIGGATGTSSIRVMPVIRNEKCTIIKLNV